MGLKTLIAGMSQYAAGVLAAALAPVGGLSGEILRKNSNTDYDFAWGNISGATITSGNIAAARITIALTTAQPVAATTLTANGAVTLTSGTASTTTGTGTLVVTGGVGISGAINSGNIFSSGSIEQNSAGGYVQIGAGNMKLYAAAFGVLGLFGTTISFPGITRNGTGIEFGLATGAAGGSVLCTGTLTSTGASTHNGGIVIGAAQTLKLGNSAVTGLAAGVLAATTNATLTLTDSAGQLYRIPCII